MRIVSHSCSNTEIICALGAAERLVGVDDHSDFPPNVVEKLARVGPDLDVDPDRVAALSPDLVVVSDTVPGHTQLIDRLRARGLPLLITAPRSIIDIAADMRNIAAAMDLAPRGEQLAEYFLQQLRAASGDAGDSLQQAVPVMIEWWPKPVIVPGQHSWATQLLAMAGACNPWHEHSQASLTVTTEQVKTAAPELIIMSWCGVQADKYRPHIVSRRSGWENIPAVASGQIHAISEALLGRPGPRLVQGLQSLRHLIKGLH